MTTPSARTPVRRALLSVSDKEGLADLARALAQAGAEIVSTGGTARALREAGLQVRDVSDLTGFPEMMDGRVKTLHPAVHAGLLALRDDPAHMAALGEHGIGPIDLIAVNLYPFEATRESGADAATINENIDIGGPAMIRAASKNHAGVAVLTDPAQYAEAIEALGAGGTTAGQRAGWAAAAFSHTARYDAAVAEWMGAEALALSAPRLMTPRYGENPHQAASFHALGARPGIAAAEALQGKPLSYNNIMDADAAIEALAEIAGAGPSCVIVKHANPCGAARAGSLAEAYAGAYDCDRTSAFGGIVALSEEIDAETARAVTSVFTEVVVAPAASEEARAIFAAKTNLRLLLTPLPDPAAPGRVLRTVAGGLLVQDRDARRIGREDCTVATSRAPTDAEWDDLIFAWRVAKHVKSNAIVYARGGRTVGIGAGQMNRRDSSRIAAQKAAEMAEALGLPESPAVGSAVASDAFFPFPDGLLAAAEAGAACVIQPGGAMRDAEVIAAADEAGLAMVLTGTRHFRH